MTWVNPNLGSVGVVGAGNSLVGQTPGDQIGSGGIVQLNNGANYLVLSPNWNNGAGAITNGNDSTMIVGAVTGDNSLVGANSNDGVGSAGSIFQTPYGYYLVTTSNFNNGAGAVTWSRDSVQTEGAISEHNSLIGSIGNGEGGDAVGNGGITLIASSQNYVVSSPDWNGETGGGHLRTWLNRCLRPSLVPATVSSAQRRATLPAAAASRCSTTATTSFPLAQLEPGRRRGPRSWAAATARAASSVPATGLIGADSGDSADFVGSGGIVVLDNGSFLVLSPDYFLNSGAVTWESESTGLHGVIGSGNSLVGQSFNDQVGSGGIFTLSNGSNYLILSPSWGNGKGAITNESDSGPISGCRYRLETASSAHRPMMAWVLSVPSSIRSITTTSSSRPISAAVPAR